MSILIKNFVDCPSDLTTVASWLIEEFFQDKPNHNVDNMVERMKKGKRDEVPIGLIAFYNDKPAGVVNLLEHDLDSPSELTPWLCGLFVHADYRNLGIATALIDKCISETKRCNYSSLYLATDIPDFYLKLGWTVNENTNQSIMRFDIEN